MTAASPVVLFTGTRADFGLLQPVGEALHREPTIEPSFIVGGTHGYERFGTTSREIEASGLPVGEVLPHTEFDDDAVSISHMSAATLSATADALHRMQPRLAIVLGDRYEALAFATACLLARLPLAHIHGGETTRGAVDDAIRNAITQMADLHFVAAEPFANRVIAMTSANARVHVTGAPGLDAVAATLAQNRPPRPVVEALTGPLPDSRPVFLLAHHPETRSSLDQGDVMTTILTTLLEYENSMVLTSAPNADWDNTNIVTAMREVQSEHPDRVRFVPSFGHDGFVHAMSFADVMIGNSSAGIIEAPFVGTPSVTIGERQAGRPLADAVFACGTSHDAIRAAVDQALTSRECAATRSLLYGDGHASSQIAGHVKAFLTNDG